MSLIRFILWSIIFYFLFKMLKVISKVFTSSHNEKENEPIYYHNKKTKIDEKDVIDADYEDLTPPKQN